MRAFVPGLTLARAFYEDVIAPLLAVTRHSAALLGTGSDVLGFDTERSTDHGWGPRLQVFVAGADVTATQHAVEDGLPEEFRGLGDTLLTVLAATEYAAREAALVAAVQAAAARHNALGVTAPVDESIGLFHDRPFRVLGSSRFVDACLERVSDPWLRSLPLTGAVDQFVDSTDVLSAPDVFADAASFYKS